MDAKLLQILTEKNVDNEFYEFCTLVAILNDLVVLILKIPIFLTRYKHPPKKEKIGYLLK